MPVPIALLTFYLMLIQKITFYTFDAKPVQEEEKKHVVFVLIPAVLFLFFVFLLRSVTCMNWYIVMLFSTCSFNTPLQ